MKPRLTDQTRVPIRPIRRQIRVRVEDPPSSRNSNSYRESAMEAALTCRGKRHSINEKRRTRVEDTSEAELVAEPASQDRSEANGSPLNAFGSCGRTPSKQEPTSNEGALWSFILTLHYATLDLPLESSTVLECVRLTVYKINVRARRRLITVVDASYGARFGRLLFDLVRFLVRREICANQRDGYTSGRK